MKRFTPLLCLLVAIPAFAAIDWLGTEPQFTWPQEDQADWPGIEWEVWVERNGGEWQLEQTVTETLATVIGQPGDVIRVGVRAKVGAKTSEQSVPSEAVTLRLLATPGAVSIYCPAGMVEVLPGSGMWTCPKQAEPEP